MKGDEMRIIVNSTAQHTNSISTPQKIVLTSKMQIVISYIHFLFGEEFLRSHPAAPADSSRLRWHGLRLRGLG